MSAAPLRIVLADDERPARLALAGMVARCPDVAIVGEAANGAEAIAVIERERPDLALLDLQMPEVDGLGVVRLLQPGCLPLIAFVTAFDEFAVQAFELNAVDYLLKPVEPARLAATIERARARLPGRRRRCRRRSASAPRPRRSRRGRRRGSRGSRSGAATTSCSSRSGRWRRSSPRASWST